jgi:hypothetical protein
MARKPKHENKKEKNMKEHVLFLQSPGSIFRFYNGHKIEVTWFINLRFYNYTFI